MTQVEEFSGKCCIKNCNIAVLAVGLCNKHWRRNKLYGSPVLLSAPVQSYKGKPAIERFMLRVDQNNALPCWMWTGGTDADGYGIFEGIAAGQLFKRAHRFSWAQHNEKPIPAGMQVSHSCDNPLCVNPLHLSLATPKANQAEKWSRGRGRVIRGVKHYNARITEADVRAIRASNEPQHVLAERYGVAQTTISDIRRRKSWRHVN